MGFTDQQFSSQKSGLNQIKVFMQHYIDFHFERMKTANLCGKICEEIVDHRSVKSNAENVFALCWETKNRR